MAYNVAVTAHAECAGALTEALMRGGQTPAALVEAEATPAGRESAPQKIASSDGAGAQARLPTPGAQQADALVFLRRHLISQ